MTQPIDSVDYWQGRLIAAQKLGEVHRAVFICDLARWQRIEAKHRQILAEHIDLDNSVLDAGCGYGRLLTLLPDGHHGQYLGVDLSPDFIDKATRDHGDDERVTAFIVADLRKLSFVGDMTFDWAILISMRPMVRRNMGDREWKKMHRELRRVSKRILYLEYDEDDPGEVEA